MLRAMELENFKAFGERTRIEFAPITLIFGENSAGKSTILQALNLLKQTRESRELGAALLPRTEGGFVDLGSFKELLFNHDTKRVLSIRLDIDGGHGSQLKRKQSRERESIESESLGIEVNFGRSQKSAVVRLRSMAIFSTQASGRVASFVPSPISKSKLQSLIRDSEIMLRIRELGRLTRSTSGIRAAKCSWLTDRDSFWESLFAEAKEQATAISSALKGDGLANVASRTQFEADREEMKRLYEEARKTLSEAESLAKDGLGNDQSLTRLVEDMQAIEESFGERLDKLDIAENYYKEAVAREAPERTSSIASAIEFYESDFSLTAFIQRMRAAELGSLVGIDGFTPLPVPSTLHERLPELRVLRSPATVEQVLSVDVVALAVKAGRLMETALDRLYPMGPYRRPPERWYIFTGTSPQDVGYRGELLPDLLFRHPKLVKDVNEWLDRLEVGYHLKVQPVGTKARDLFEVRLLDRRRHRPVDVALSDVGFGISQILPFVVQSLAGKQQIITIEQPEVHIHPRLQADLGDLLAAAIDRPRNHRFIIETHSEHLVLRMQRLIRKQKLRPEDVSVIYVSRSEKGSEAKRLHLDDDGDFVDDWPGGFFPERLNELR